MGEKITTEANKADSLFSKFLAYIPNSLFGSDEVPDTTLKSVVSIQNKNYWFLANLESQKVDIVHHRVGIFNFKKGYFNNYEQFYSYYNYVASDVELEELPEIVQFKSNVKTLLIELTEPMIRRMQDRFKDQLNEIYDKEQRLKLIQELEAKYIVLYGEFLETIMSDKKSEHFTTIITKSEVATKQLTNTIKKKNGQFSIYLFIKYLVLEYCIEFNNNFIGLFSIKIVNTGEHKRLLRMRLKIFSEIKFEF